MLMEYGISKEYFLEYGFLNSIRPTFKLRENLSTDSVNYSWLAETFVAAWPRLWFSSLNCNKTCEEVFMSAHVFIIKF